jgi:transposase
LDSSPITARSLQKPYRINGDEFERAYKNHLSGFRTWKHAEHAQKWLIFPRNVGPNVCIDETAVSNGELYTIVSNKDAHCKDGALIAIVSGTKVEDVVAALKKIHWYQRAKVLEVTMDFSESMHSIVTESFPFAMITIDRFHMQQLPSDAMQELRVKYRREAVKEQLEQKKVFKESQKSRVEKNKKRRKKGSKDPRGRKPERLNQAFRPERHANGETSPELLSRSRYQLMVSQDKWTETQKERGRILFELYPDIKESYSLVHSLRCIFNNRGATKSFAANSIKEWFKKVEAFGNDAFNVAASTIKDRLDEVLNYFVNRSTNASAESLNSKIKQFRAQLRGVIDVNFFLFRLSMIFG